MEVHVFNTGNIVLLCVLMIASIMDIRSNRIPNWLTFSAVILGLGLNFILGGVSGLLYSAAGLFTGVSLLILLYAFGGMGAGDVKLMGAVGAMIGPQMVLWAALYTALIGGIYAIVLMIIHPRLKAKRAAVVQTLKGLIFFRTFNYNKPIETQNAPKLCYGVAIAIGTIAAVIIKSV